MNLRDLKYLIAVAETRHFGRAAQRCYVSQPTLSGQIKKLEELLGITVFERTNRSVTITPIGEELVRHARLIMEQVDSIEQLAIAQRDPLAGELRIGMIPTVSTYLIPVFLPVLTMEYQQLKPVFSEHLTTDLLEALAVHDIDVAIIATEHDHPDFITVNLFDEPFWFVHPINHALKDSESICEADLAFCNLLLLADGHCFADQVRDLCTLHEQSQNFADIQATSLETLLQLVAAGYGCTLVPALSTKGPWTTDMGVIVRKIDFPDARRRIRLCYRKTFPRQKAIEALVSVIKDNLPNTVSAQGD